MRPVALIVAMPAFFCVLCSTVRAETPQQIFKQVSPSVVVVHVSDAKGKPVALGSGVVIHPDVVITNCHVAHAGPRLVVSRSDKNFPARLRYADTDRDLCELSVPNLSAPPAMLGKSQRLQVGQMVYAIGAPEGLELTISSGLISGLRSFGVIQTTAPISPGSSGGGLFDGQGRLIGITTFYLSKGQNLNFALPVDWIAELPERSKAEAQAAASQARIEYGRILRAAALEERNDWQGMKKLAESWVAQEPRAGLAWETLGAAYFGLGRYESAVNAFRKAIRLIPGVEDLWVNLGIAYTNLGKRDEAARAYKEATHLNPKDENAWVSLGGTYAMLMQPDNAVDAEEKALRLKPDDEVAWYYLGVAYGILGQYGKIVSAEHEAVRLKPEDAKAWAILGMGYSRLGQQSRAIEVYKKLKALNPRLADEFFRTYILP